MNEDHLFEEERFLTHTNDGIITLTNRRLRYSKKGKERSHLFSVLLENIGSIELKFSSKPILWKLALLFFLIGGGLTIYGLVEEEQGAPVPVIIGGVIALILLIIYFATMKHVLFVQAKSGEGFSFSGKGMKKGKVVDFMNDLEKAMKERNEMA